MYENRIKKPIMHITQSILNKSSAQISVTDQFVSNWSEQFEFRPIRSSTAQINQPEAFKIQIVYLNLMY